ncbi:MULTISPECIES: hypothetical protein [Idiomarina]|uniref:hypothetical protein n=1 Tax=Idiomarina TaxID=135575 RepID=UPI00129B2835|nr:MULTISPECIES: hypothetical protein [Idiomarina]MRJ41186.1 hypothetical protein [Idiomarina sp. FeN1]NCU56351.1 hypothetical protein [Idiomarina sp. FenA--70]NCU59370.1 hypothetical protein [Idiomarina sp. FenBw--71]UUN12545.1 hypothetical protein KGF88_07705 [Idiomarina loihiensis]
MSQEPDVISAAMRIAASDPTLANAKELNRLMRSAKGDDKDAIADLIETFLMSVQDPQLRMQLMDELH